MKERIKAVRKNDVVNGKNQQQFADFLGISMSNLASYESGRRAPSSAVIKLISEKCNVNETWLRTGKGSMHDPITQEQSIAQVVQALTVKSDVVKSAMITALSKMDEQDLRKLLTMILNALTDQGVDVTDFLN